MGNHYHLLLETPQANLVAGMKWLQGTYTQRFNARHKLYGHLFQGRYQALNVDTGERRHSQVIAQRLSMGHEARVTLAVRTVSGTKRGRLGRLRERIAGITRDHS